MDVGTSEDGAFWLAFLRSLSARGLGGVELVVSALIRDSEAPSPQSSAEPAGNSAAPTHDPTCSLGSPGAPSHG